MYDKDLYSIIVALKFYNLNVKIPHLSLAIISLEKGKEVNNVNILNELFDFLDEMSNGAYTLMTWVVVLICYAALAGAIILGSIESEFIKNFKITEAATALAIDSTIVGAFLWIYGRATGKDRKYY